MARPQAEAKLCYYPASPIAIGELLKHLRVVPPNPERKADATNVIDPCCGEGKAIHQIAAGLDIQEEHVHAVELDGARSDAARALMPKHKHIGPASFLGSMITGHSMGLAYVNPPYGSELGGGRREEASFAQRATHLLVPKGVLALVVPIHGLVGNRSFCAYLDANYEDAALYRFPDGDEPATGQPIRPYKEVVFLGKKRRQELPIDAAEKVGKLHLMMAHWGGGYVPMESLPALGQTQPTSWYNGRPGYDREPELRVWEIPPSWAPNTFKKIAFTDEELLAAIGASPLNRVLSEVPTLPPNCPPLPLDKGHLGLILASGMLDGVVEGPHGVHVVRGSSHKVEYHNKEASSSEANPETGAVTTKDVFSQRMVTVIRCADESGTIHTYSNTPQEEPEDEAA
jgi:predicted RNA methylase